MIQASINTTPITARAVFYMSPYLDEYGRAIIGGAVDFSKSGVWCTEAYVIFCDKALSAGVKVSSDFDPKGMPPQWIPSLEEELQNRIKFAESLFWKKLRNQDRELAIWIRGLAEQFAGPLTDFQLAHAHMSGDFGDQITGILGRSDCSVVTEIIKKLDALPKVRTQTIPQTI